MAHGGLRESHRPGAFDGVVATAEVRPGLSAGNGPRELYDSLLVSRSASCLQHLMSVVFITYYNIIIYQLEV